MTDHLSFEARLADALGRYADRAIADIDPYDVAAAAAARARHGRRGSVLDLARGRSAPRMALAVGVLLVALVAGLLAVVGSRLLDRQPSVDLGMTSPFTATVRPAVDRMGPLAVPLPDGRVLVVGGVASDDRASSSALGELFDPASGRFVRTGSMTTTRTQFGTATVLTDGRVLVAGGMWYDTDNPPPQFPERAELYDPAAGTFGESGALAIPRYGHTATMLADGRVLVVGGSADDQAALDAVARAELFDPATGTFRTVGRLSVPRAYHAATLLADGRVIVTGGFGLDERAGAGVLAAVELFDPATETFTTAPPMRDARSGHTATSLPDGRVLLAGGSAPGGPEVIGDAALASAELFDPAASAFVETGSLRTDRSDHSATLLSDGRVLVAGGFNADGQPRSVEIYDPATGRFELAGLAPESLGNARSAVLPDGRVLLVGGEGRPQLFDPRAAQPDEDRLLATPAPDLAQAFGPAAPPSAERLGHTATLLEDGRVLVAGGRLRDDTPLASAELYDPVADAWSDTGPLTVARASFAAVRLTDGRVLLAGGEPDAASAETYDPATEQFTRLGAVEAGLVAGRPVLLALPDGRVLVVSGGGGGSRQASIFDPNTATFERVGSVCSSAFSAIALPDGRVLIGCEGDWAPILDPGTGRLSDAADYPWGTEAGVRLPTGAVLVVDRSGNPPVEHDPASGSWSSLTEVRPGPYPPVYPGVASVLEDGRVVVITSDRSAAEPEVSARLIDPATGAERAIAPPLAARFEATATLLGDGRVLVVGAPVRRPDRIGAVPPLAELFDPTKIP